VSGWFQGAAHRVAGWAGSPWFFGANVALVAVWLASGPLFSWGDTWQLVMTTGLTVTTQLLVILIQATQNRDERAIHLKLDEVLRAIATARTELVRAEEMGQDEVEARIEQIKREASSG
jgi:low affinity Fe/Cu permease